MADAALTADELQLAIKEAIGTTPTTFVQLARALPQMRGTEDLVITAAFILWRGLSAEGVGALRALHAERAIHFWLCSPSVYSRTGDAPFLRLMSSTKQLGDQPWLPTLICDRPPSTDESRKAVRDYVAEMSLNRRAFG